jgi:hypothetical protein
MLRSGQIDRFIEQGFVRLDHAFPRDVADRGRAILWADTGGDPADPSPWTRPVVWLWAYDQAPFVRAANTPLLHSAFDQLVGRGRWQPRDSLGTFPVRFPSQEDTGDTGWHVDASFPGEDADPHEHRSQNISQGQYVDRGSSRDSFDPDRRLHLHGGLCRGTCSSSS